MPTNSDNDNSVDPDQTAPLGTVWSGSTLFVQILRFIRKQSIDRRTFYYRITIQLLSLCCFIDLILPGDYVQTVTARWTLQRKLPQSPYVLGQMGIRKQCRPRLDWRSSLIRVYTVCDSFYIIWMHCYMLKPRHSNFRIIAVKFTCSQVITFLR